jgi:hypothetical protein
MTRNGEQNHGAVEPSGLNAEPRRDQTIRPALHTDGYLGHPLVFLIRVTRTSQPSNVATSYLDLDGDHESRMVGSSGAPHTYRQPAPQRTLPNRRSVYLSANIELGRRCKGESC